MNKLSKLIMTLIMLMCSAGLIAALSGCEDKVVDGLGFHSINGGKEYEVYAAKSLDKIEIVIPGHYRNRPVTRIADYGFFDDYNQMGIYDYNESNNSVDTYSSASVAPIMTPPTIRENGRTNNITSITIPSTVTSVGAYAFVGCDALVDITVSNENKSIKSDGNCIVDIETNWVLAGTNKSIIPDYVEGVMPEAFLYTGLWKDTPADSVFYVQNWAVSHKGESGAEVLFKPGTVGIGDWFFYGKQTLSTVNLPESLKHIGLNAFRNSSLESIEIPNGVTKINDSVFYGNSLLADVVLPQTLTSIGYGAFGHCKELKHITIPEGVVSIGAHAFEQSELSSVHLPSSLTNLGLGAFSGNSIQSMTVSDSNTLYKSDGHCIIEIAANKLVAGSVNSIIPDYVKIIGESAFYQVPVNNVKLPEGLTTIEDAAFYNSVHFHNITLPSTLTGIGPYAFSDTSFNSVTIPKTVARIGKGAFDGRYLTIYVEGISSKLKGWSDIWATSAANVVWGCTLSATKTYVVSFTKTKGSITVLNPDGAGFPYDPDNYTIYAPDREGYVFSNWNTKTDGSGTGYIMNSKLRADEIPDNTKLYAIWE